MHVDPETRRPPRLPPEFERIYGPSAGERRPRSSLRHPSAPPDGRRAPGVVVRPAEDRPRRPRQQPTGTGRWPRQIPPTSRRSRPGRRGPRGGVPAREIGHGPRDRAPRRGSDALDQRPRRHGSPADALDRPRLRRRLVAEPLDGGAEDPRDLHLRDADPLADLALRQVLDEAQVQDLAVALRQRLEPLLEHHVVLDLVEVLVAAADLLDERDRAAVVASAHRRRGVERGRAGRVRGLDRLADLGRCRGWWPRRPPLRPACGPSRSRGRRRRRGSAASPPSGRAAPASPRTGRGSGAAAHRGSSGSRRRRSRWRGCRRIRRSP